MNVIARPSAVSRRRRRRGARAEVPAAAEPAGGPRRSAGSAPHRRADPPQDSATYSCGCGYVFAATVSTSVACPHCGDAQAW